MRDISPSVDLYKAQENQKQCPPISPHPKPKRTQVPLYNKWNNLILLNFRKKLIIINNKKITNKEPSIVNGDCRKKVDGRKNSLNKSNN